MAGLRNKSIVAVDKLCDIDVYAIETLADNIRTKGIYLKLIPATVITKSKLTFIIRVFGYLHENFDN